MLKKTIRRLGALAMVLAMAVSVFAVNASATSEVVPTTNPAVNATITKNVIMDANVLAPADEFEFVVEPGAATTLDGVPVTPGKANDISITKAKVTRGDTAVTGSATLTVKANAYQTPGIYRYKLTEKAGNLDGMTYDTATEYDVYVYVKNAENNYATTITVLKDKKTVAVGSNTGKAQLVFNNTYATNDLKVSKEIKGDFTTGNETFAFTLGVGSSTELNGKTLAQKYSVVVYDKEGHQKGDAKEVTLDGTVNVTLGQGDYVMVYGLTEYNTYTVKEDKHGEDGFTTTVDVTDAYATLDETTKTTKSNAKITKDQTVAYTNTKDPTTPTGVIMTIAPYALMVVLAGAFAVVFLTRRNRAE